MAVRIISAVVGFFILLAFVLIGGLPVEIGAAGLSLIGMYELYTAVSKKLKPVHFVGFAAEIYYVFGYHYAGLHSAAINLPVIMAAVMLTLVFLVAMHESTDINDVSITWFGFLYVGVLMYCLVLLYKVDKARTRSYGGSGIGLSVVKAAVDRLGGSCGVRNLKDGVEFTAEI